MENNKKFKINYLVLKIAGAVLCCAGIVFLIIAICNYGEKNNNSFASFAMSGIPFLFAGAICLVAGLRPEIENRKAKKHHTKQTTIHVCKKCEKKIDSDSVFCKHCGEKQ